MSEKTDPKRDLGQEVKSQHDTVGITAISDQKSDYKRTSHPDAQWYSEATLGPFFHWGISSVGGQGDLSWGMMKSDPERTQQMQADQHGIYALQMRMSPAKYWKQAEQFLCENYDPDKWLSAAKEAGIEYVVLTTKHHDGFCLWPSDYGELSTKNYLGGRDLVGEFVDACRKYDIKIGFYYSPPDFLYFRDQMTFGKNRKPPYLDENYEPFEVDEKDTQRLAEFKEDYAGSPIISLPHGKEVELLDGYRALCNGHVRELLTRYGEIDIIWFDGRMPKGAMTMDDIREIQPHILINPRGYGVGDFDTPECKFPKERMEPGWWELCYVFSDGAWGYLDHETYKPIGWLLAEWAKVRAWDGKFLPNVGPDSKGEMPPAYYKRMEQLKEWRAHSGESMVGTTGSCWPEESNVPLTHKDGKTYAHLDWMFMGPVEIKCLKEAPKSVKSLKTGESIPFTYENGILTFEPFFDFRSNKLDTFVIE